MTAPAGLENNYQPPESTTSPEASAPARPAASHSTKIGPPAWFGCECEFHLHNGLEVELLRYVTTCKKHPRPEVARGV